MPAIRKAHKINIGRADTGRSVETEAQVKARERRLRHYTAAVSARRSIPYPRREKGE